VLRAQTGTPRIVAHCQFPRGSPPAYPRRREVETMELISLIAFLALIAAWIVAPERGTVQA